MRRFYGKNNSGMIKNNFHTIYIPLLEKICNENSIYSYDSSIQRKLLSDHDKLFIELFFAKLTVKTIRFLQ